MPLCLDAHHHLCCTIPISSGSEVYQDAERIGHSALGATRQVPPHASILLPSPRVLPLCQPTTPYTHHRNNVHRASRTPKQSAITTHRSACRPQDCSTIRTTEIVTRSLLGLRSQVLQEKFLLPRITLGATAHADGPYCTATTTLQECMVDSKAMSSASSPALLPAHRSISRHNDTGRKQPSQRHPSLTTLA